MKTVYEKLKESASNTAAEHINTDIIAEYMAANIKSIKNIEDDFDDLIEQLKEEKKELKYDEKLDMEVNDLIRCNYNLQGVLHFLADPHVKSDEVDLIEGLDNFNDISFYVATESYKNMILEDINHSIEYYAENYREEITKAVKIEFERQRLAENVANF